jgi:pyruvate kinase
MYTPQPVVTAETVASTAVNTVLDLPVELIVVLTETGRFARLIAKYRPPVPILALSKSSEVIKSLQTTRGVVGKCIKDFTSEEDLCN